jgi:putative ABC transport system substrate-binding protein
VKRRQFITLLGGAAAASSFLWPLAARAQNAGKVRRIGFVAGGKSSLIPMFYGAFLEGMRSLGYAEGRNIAVEWRFAEGREERYAEFGAELVRMKVDVIVLATPAAVPAIARATSVIPIVMAYSTDPVGNGFVASLARPGGNITGLASSIDDATSKQLEMLVSVVPNISRVAYLAHAGNSGRTPIAQATQLAAGKLGLTVVPIWAGTAQEVEDAFNGAAKERLQAFVVSPDAFFFSYVDEIAQLALAARLPTMFAQREYVAAGGLMSYGENLRDFFQRSASVVDRIFKGAKPSEIPIEQPIYFKLVINRDTADALGIAITPALRILADEVIE